MIVAVIATATYFVNTVGDVIHHIDTRNALLFEVVNSLAFLFTENRNQHIRASNFLFARRLHMKHGAL